ncbi:hypothetical protein BH11PSE11_BH11PSE11_14860 [soil metagenome]
MTPSEVISNYEHIVELTSKMVVAAKSDEWDDFGVLEDQCAGESKRMLEAMIPPLSGEARLRKFELLRQILANDREIRSITEPWMDPVANAMKAPSSPQKATQSAIA